MQTSAAIKLHTLKDTDLTTRHHDEDIRSRKVVDASGADIGRIDQLLIDGDQRKVRFVRISSGGFLGIGSSKVLVPVDAIVAITKDLIRINQNRAIVTAAPGYDPELVDDAYYSALYTHYGVSPYWSPGYLYPPYPHYSGAGSLR